LKYVQDFRQKSPNPILLPILKIPLNVSIFSEFPRYQASTAKFLRSDKKIVRACVRLSAWLFARPAVALVYICLCGLYCTLPYCTVLYCFVLTVQYVIVLIDVLYCQYCIVLYCFVLTVLYVIVLINVLYCPYNTVLYCFVLTVQYVIVLGNVLLYCQYCTVLYCFVLTVLYVIVLSNVLYCPYCTVLLSIYLSDHPLFSNVIIIE